MDKKSRTLKSILGGTAIGWGITWGMNTIRWLLFSSEGQWYNEETVPLIIELRLGVESLLWPVTWILIISWIFLVYQMLEDW
jgi:hypothetical protein